MLSNKKKGLKSTVENYGKLFFIFILFKIKIKNIHLILILI